VTSYFEHFKDITSGHLKLVDLRSPGEFAQGAMPRAVNVPLFNDQERAQVGTTYKQIGQLDAIQQGLEIVSSKIQSLVDELETLAGPERRIALHCWRGGMRSGSVAKLLNVIGIETILLRGGYKTYRNQVIQQINDFSKHNLLVLNGRTGSGKTQLIHEMINLGAPVIDFEGLARHRGSALGNLNIQLPQPTQQHFENLLANAYFSVRNQRTIIVEIEQNIGRIQMPVALRQHIAASKMILIERNIEDRINHIANEYAPTWTNEDSEKFAEGILLLKKHLQGDMFDRIVAHVAKKELTEAIRLLIVHRYDKCYDKAIKRQTAHILETIHLSSNFAQSAERIIHLASMQANTSSN
jgi:tRNA 2-selenouridine synthase